MWFCCENQGRITTHPTKGSWDASWAPDPLRGYLAVPSGLWQTKMLRVEFFNKPLILQLSCREKRSRAPEISPLHLRLHCQGGPKIGGQIRVQRCSSCPGTSSGRMETLERAFPPTVHFESVSAAPDQLFRPVHSLNSVFIFYQRNMRTQFKESDSCMKLDKKIVFFDPPLPEAIISCYFGWFFL